METRNSTISIKGIKNNFFRLRITSVHLKIILILNYILLLSALIIILYTPPIDSYEFSIYGAYPLFFWFLLLSSIILGQMSAILSILNDSIRKYWILGFLAQVIAVSLVSFLPLIRGYYIYGSGDILTHIGYMLDIERSGMIGRNHYPILHITGVSLHEISSLSYGAITMVIPSIFFLIAILYWYILGREIISDTIGVTFLVLVGTLPLFSNVDSLFTPNHQAFLLIPLFFYILIKYQKMREPENAIILTLLSILLVLIHPLIAVMVILLYFLLHCSDFFYSKFFSCKNKTRSILKILLIMLILFSMWSSYLILFIRVAKPFTASLLGTDEIKSEIGSKLDLLSNVDIDMGYLINLMLHIYGVPLILALSSLFCILFLLILHFRKRIPILQFQFFSIICFFTFFVFGIILFLKLSLFGMIRVLNFALLFALIIISNTITIISQKNAFYRIFTKLLFYIPIAIAVILLVYFSVFSLHLSPIVKMPNQQVTEGNYFIMNSFFDKRDDAIKIIELGVSQKRYFDSIYGVNYPATNIQYGELTLPIDHFGYNASPYLGSNYDEKQYFLFSKEGRGFYENMYPEFPDKWRFTRQDFQMLEIDPSVERIFSNENLNIYLIKETFQ